MIQQLTMRTLFISALCVLSALSFAEAAVEYKMVQRNGRTVIQACERQQSDSGTPKCADVTTSRQNGSTQACYKLGDAQKQCQSVQATCQQMGGGAQSHACQTALQTGEGIFGKKTCPDGTQTTLNCTNGSANDGQAVSCGGASITVPFMTLGYQQPQGETQRFSMNAVCHQNTSLNVQLRFKNAVVAERKECPISELKSGNTAVVFWYDQSRPRVLTEAEKKTGKTREDLPMFKGRWYAACTKADAEKLQEELRPKPDLNPNTATATGSQAELAKKAQSEPGKEFRHDIDDTRRIVATCDAQGKCQYQTFVKNEQGEWVPKSSPVSVDKDKLDDELKKINSAEAFDRVAQTNPHRGSTSTPPDSEKDKNKNPTPPAGPERPPQQPTNDGSGFKPTSSSSNPKEQPKQGGQPQQQRPQQNQQLQQPNMPAPYCAGINANKREITEGEQVTIQWNIPYAIRYELRGGSGNINGSSVTVRPKETTAYSVVGYGIPGAGQNTGGYGQYGTYGQQQTLGQYDTGTALDGTPINGNAYAQQSYPQYTQPQQQSCGIPGAACCGPITITVKPRKIIQRDVIVADEDEDEAEEDYTTLEPEIRCSPKDVEDGKSATIVWSCPDDSRRATSLAKHLNGTPLSETESFYIEGKTSGSLKVTPQSSTVYAVRCISTKAKRSATSSCSVRVVPKSVQTERPTAVKRATTTASTTDMKLSIVAEPTKIAVGTQEVNIIWRTANVDSCTVVGPNGFTQNTNEGKVSGTSDKPGPLTFTLTCKKGSETRTRSVKVDVQ
jgi:hypothetical protein